METLKNILFGPFYDLKRFVVGSLTAPTPSRVLSEEGLAAARAVLSWANCDLRRCTEENLHTWSTSLPPDQVFDLLLNWQLWPPSAFFACPSTDQNGVDWFSYRCYTLIPVVNMRLKSAIPPRYIIYDIISGVGAGGYHSFLLEPPSPTNQQETFTKVSIYTTFPPSPLFFEGLHDQVNFDIYRKLERLSKL